MFLVNTIKKETAYSIANIHSNSKQFLNSPEMLPGVILLVAGQTVAALHKSCIRLNIYSYSTNNKK